MRCFWTSVKCVNYKCVAVNAKGIGGRRLLINTFAPHLLVEKPFLTSHLHSFTGVPANLTKRDQDYFQKVVENNPDYPEHSLIEDPLVQNRLSSNKLVKVIRDLTSSGRTPGKIFHYEFDFACKDFLDSSFTVDDIIEILIRLPMESLNRKHHVEQLQKLLRMKISELNDKRKHIDKLFLLLHLFKNFPNLKLAASEVISFLSDYHSELTNSQLVIYYYMLHFYRYFPVDQSRLYNVDMFLSKQMLKMTLDEIAVITYALFICNKIPGEWCCKVVAKKLMENLESVTSTQAYSLCKFIQKGCHCSAGNTISAILEKFISIMPTYPLSLTIRIACMGANINIVNADLLKRIIKRALTEGRSIRLKDYSRLIIAALACNFDIRMESEFIKNVTEEIKQRRRNIMCYPLPYVSLLKGLTSYEIYLDEEYSFIFSKQFLEPLRKDSSYQILRELLYLDVTLELERPNYRGVRLPVEKRNEIAKEELDRCIHSVGLMLSHQIKYHLNNIYGKASCVVKHLLPHYRSWHPVVCLSDKNQSREIGDRLERPIGEVVRPPQDDNIWVCFVLVEQFDCLLGTHDTTINMNIKMKHFKLAGYLPLMVYREEWIRKTNDGKRRFLRRAIEEEIYKYNER